MSSVDHHTTYESSHLAAAARSILACPASVNLVVDGVDDVLEGMDGLASMDGLGMQDLGGHPTFSCLPNTPLARAALARRSALLTLSSGLGADSSPDRGATLTVAGRLEPGPTERCDCCGEARQVVGLELNFVLLSRTDSGHPSEQFRVPLRHFVSPDHHLNRGFLQRSVEHANRCHQDELRRAVSNLTHTRLAEIVGVALSDLLPHRVDVRWVGVDGAHSRTLVFPQPATTTDELSELLRRQLHAGLC